LNSVVGVSTLASYIYLRMDLKVEIILVENVQAKMLAKYLLVS